MGLGSLFPVLNLVAQPFVCPGGRMVNNSQTYQVSPVENVTSPTWICVNNQTGAKTQPNPFVINLFAGSIYGLLIIATLLGIVYFYRRWGSSKEPEYIRKRVAWIQGGCVVFVIGGITLINLMPVIRDLIPTPTTITDTTATSIASTYEALTMGKPIDFKSTEQPLDRWKGIPILPEAVAGQETKDGAYQFRISINSAWIWMRPSLTTATI